MASAISPYPDLRIVISSAWRKDMSLHVLKELFSASVRGRVIDITPTIDNEISGYWRYEEIRLWVRLHRYEGGWLAIDDAVHEFPPECQQLIACDIRYGFDAHVAEKLKTAIEQSNRYA
jgi:hypothetical protein